MDGTGSTDSIKGTSNDHHWQYCIQGVNVDVDGVNVDIDGVNVDVDGVNVDVDGVNVDVDGANVDVDGVNVGDEQRLLGRSSSSSSKRSA